jgi:hypothetical protein
VTTPPGSRIGDAAAALQLIRRSWTLAVGDRPALEHELGAQVHALLPRPSLDPHGAAVRLVTAVDDALSLLDTPEALVRHSRVLGRTADACGVGPLEYDSLIAALLRTLDAQLGTAFDATVHDAWLEYGMLISALMRRSGEREARTTASGSGRGSAAAPAFVSADDDPERDPAVTGAVELGEKELLPGTQHEGAVLDEQGEARAGEGDLQVGVGVALSVAEAGLTGDETSQEADDVIGDVGIRTLVDGERAGGVQ